MGKQARRRKERRERNAKARDEVEVEAESAGPARASERPWWQRPRVTALVGALVLGGGALAALLLARGAGGDGGAVADAADAAPAVAPGPKQVREQEPNDTAQGAQVVPFGAVTIRGSTAPGQRDVFAFDIADHVYVVDAEITGADGATLGVSRDGTAALRSATSPVALRGTGLAPGRSFVSVEGGQGAYSLRLGFRRWAQTREFEPNDHRNEPGAMHTKRVTSPDEKAWAPTIEMQRVSGHLDHDKDVDCHRVALSVPATGAVLELALFPAASLTPSIAVIDPRKQIMWSESGKGPGTPLRHPALGAKSWQRGYVACIGAVDGAGPDARYRFEVRTRTPREPVEFEPNPDKKRASALPRNLAVAGYLTSTDVDWYRISSGKRGAVEVVVSGIDGVAMEVRLLDMADQPLAEQLGGAGQGVRVSASNPVHVIVRAVSGGNTTQRYSIRANDASGRPR